jgi:hypothetical protein
MSRAASPSARFRAGNLQVADPSGTDNERNNEKRKTKKPVEFSRSFTQWMAEAEREINRDHKPVERSPQAQALDDAMMATALDLLGVGKLTRTEMKKLERDRSFLVAKIDDLSY